MLINVSQEVQGGVLDYIEIEPYGVIRVVGWSREAAPPQCYILARRQKIEPTRFYRRSRPDVAQSLGLEDTLLGFSIEFHVSARDEIIAVLSGILIPIPLEETSLGGVWAPAYGELLNGDRVLNRNDIYRFGDPSDEIHPDILALALRLVPPILDFGCGSGALVRKLCQLGKGTLGIELDRQPIRNAIRSDVADKIVLYDGQAALPFGNARFESVIATEVIEHIPAFEPIIAEIARVCRSQFALTVPDMSCIPIGSRHGVVPTHLLESTHVNFFNHRSLEVTLRPHFRSLEFFQLAAGRVNGDFMPGSLGVIANK